VEVAVAGLGVARVVVGVSRVDWVAESVPAGVALAGRSEVAGLAGVLLDGMVIYLFGSSWFS